MRKNTFILLLAILALGCVPQKDVVYLQNDKNTTDLEQTFSNIKSQNTIKIFDQIYIQVSSFDDGNLNFMSNDANRYGGGRSEADLAIVSYTVKKDGTVELPILGNTKVVNLTPDQASEKIRKELQSYLNTPSVKISFVNKSITVIGSVNQPGRYFYASEHLNVFQALGLAGDISEYGNRKEVVIIRDINNEVIKKRINLTDVQLLGNTDLYIRPDDVLYVEPLKRRHWGFQSFPWALILSSVTTFVLVANYVKE
ncbi:polysaccharide export protein [Labilibacter sediminis]|nr:polysaccharide export protein [Labilibacter sediminis]